MRLIPILAAGLAATLTLAAPVGAQYHGYHHRGYHHGYHHRGPIRRWHHRRDRRLVCSRYWHHHRLVRRCRTIWY